MLTCYAAQILGMAHPREGIHNLVVARHLDAIPGTWMLKHCILLPCGVGHCTLLLPGQCQENRLLTAYALDPNHSLKWKAKYVVLHLAS